MPPESFETEADLQALDLPTLAEKSRQAWNAVKGQIPSDVLERIEPQFNVLTDDGYISRQVKEMAGAGTDTSH